MTSTSTRVFSEVEPPAVFMCPCLLDFGFGCDLYILRKDLGKQTKKACCCNGNRGMQDMFDSFCDL